MNLVSSSAHQQVGSSIKYDKSQSRPCSASLRKSSSVDSSIKATRKKRKRETDCSDDYSEYETEEYREYRKQPSKKQAVVKKYKKDGSTQCEVIIIDKDNDESHITIGPRAKICKVDEDEEEVMISIEIISTSPTKKDQHLQQQTTNNKDRDADEEEEMTLEIINYNSRNSDNSNSGESSNCSAPLSLPESENSSRSDCDSSDSPSEDVAIEASSAEVINPQPQQSQFSASSSFKSAVSVARVPLPVLHHRVTMQKQLFRYQYMPLYGQAPPRAPLLGIGTAIAPARRNPLQYHPDLLAMGMQQGGTTYRLGSNGAVLKNEEKK